MLMIRDINLLFWESIDMSAVDIGIAVSIIRIEPEDSLQYHAHIKHCIQQKKKYIICSRNRSHFGTTTNLLEDIKSMFLDKPTSPVLAITLKTILKYKH